MVSTLEIDGVQFGFSAEKLLLSDVYLKCQSGKITALLGRNGSGKSTLLQLLFGTLQADNCSVRLNGKYLLNAFRSREVAYLPQKNFLPMSLTVKQVAWLFVPRKEAREELLNDERIKSFLGQPIKELSGGQLRYLEVRLLLSLPARFLLLDEPFLGMEPLYRELLQQVLKEAASTKGILLTDHDYCSVLEIADEIYLLREGAVRLIKEHKELVEFGYLSG